MFKLKIYTKNAAFENTPEEVIRILREAILKLEQGKDEAILFDLNGNRVGIFTLNKR